MPTSRMLTLAMREKPEGASFSLMVTRKEDSRRIRLTTRSKVELTPNKNVIKMLIRKEKTKDSGIDNDFSLHTALMTANPGSMNAIRREEDSRK